jgi:outer membrane protein assembly factor BamB
MAMTDFREIEAPRMRVLTAGQVVAVGHAGHVHLLQLESGNTLWSYALSGKDGATACEGQPVTVGIVGDVVLAGAMGHVFALDLETGDLLWHKDHRARGAGETTFAFGGPGSDYVSSLAT